MKRIIIFVPGILNFPGEHTNWDGRAITWMMSHCYACAESMDYLALVFTRALWHKKRVGRLQEMLSHYRGFHIDLVGHSNGCHIIADAVRTVSVSNVHLVCAACEADFNKNGLNDAIAKDRVLNVKVYCAGDDDALALASLKPAQWLGYGHLGRCGPKHILFPGRVQTIKTFPWTMFGHSTCWNDSNFDATMKNFI